MPHAASGTRHRTLFAGTVPVSRLGGARLPLPTVDRDAGPHVA
jgi:hypothetical protein